MNDKHLAFDLLDVLKVVEPILDEVFPDNPKHLSSNFFDASEGRHDDQPAHCVPRGEPDGGTRSERSAHNNDSVVLYLKLFSEVLKDGVGVLKDGLFAYILRLVDTISWILHGDNPALSKIMVTFKLVLMDMQNA